MEDFIRESDFSLKKVEGYDDYYITSTGIVFSTKYKEKRVLKPRKNRGGYMYVNLCKHGKYNSVPIHRLVAKHFLVDFSETLVVNHIDGNKTNNNVQNLEMVTISENNIHAERLGLTHHKVGEEHPMAKLSEKDVIEIRKKKLSGYTNKEIANLYNMSLCQIKNITSGKKWKCLL